MHHKAMCSKFTRKEIGKLIRSNYHVVRRNEWDIRAAPINCTGNLSRILIITSRKVGNAVVRNKVRRRIKSIFYEEKLQNIKYDIVIFCKPGIHKLTFIELKNLILHHVQSLPSLPL